MLDPTLAPLFRWPPLQSSAPWPLANVRLICYYCASAQVMAQSWPALTLRRFSGCRHLMPVLAMFFPRKSPCSPPQMIGQHSGPLASQFPTKSLAVGLSALGLPR